MIRALLSTFIAFAAICSVPAQADTVFGAVTAVSDDGEIMLDTEENLYLWGMVPTDPKLFRNALVGRRLYCTEVFGAMDCLLFPRDEDQLASPISALIWLPDLGVAKYSCYSTSILHADFPAWGFSPGSYECRDGKPEFPPSSIGLIRSREVGAILEKRRILLDRRRQITSP